MINYIWILIGKKLNNEASISELEELERLLKEDTVGHYPVELMEMIWKMKEEPDAEISQIGLEENWERLSPLLQNSAQDHHSEVTERKQIRFNRRKVQKYIIAFAACFLLIFSIVGVIKMFLLEKPGANKSNKIEIATANGAIRKISLPDGSSVTLNSGSNITYKKSFDANHRELSLSGEALFDIVKDPKHPFVVHTQSMKIRVLGTEFNVKAYPDDKIAEASLFRGSIELTVINEPERQILLKPSEKIKIIKESDSVLNATETLTKIPSIKLIELGQINQNLEDTIPEEIMWLDHKIVFDSEEFGEIAKEMERKYNVSIVFQNQDAKKFRFTGRFKDVPIDQALEQLQLIANFNYRSNGKTIQIY